MNFDLTVFVVVTVVLVFELCRGDAAEFVEEAAVVGPAAQQGRVRNPGEVQSGTGWRLVVESNQRFEKPLARPHVGRDLMPQRSPQLNRQPPAILLVDDVVRMAPRPLQLPPTAVNGWKRDRMDIGNESRRSPVTDIEHDNLA